MATTGGQPGNKNGAYGHAWRNALKRAIAKSAEEGTVSAGLNRIACAVVAKALEGDKDSWQEIAQRMDGKVASVQILTGDAKNPIAVSGVVRHIVDPKE